MERDHRWTVIEKNTANQRLIKSLGALCSMYLPSGKLFKGYQEDEKNVYAPRYAISGSIVEPVGGVNVAWGCSASSRNEKEEEAWQALRSAHSGVLVLACGKGKSVQALRKIAYEGKKALVVVHTKDLLEQWVDEVAAWMSIDGRPIARSEIGIAQGKKAQFDRPICIALIHALSNGIPKEHADDFGIVVYDEAHHLSAPSWYGAAAAGRYQRIALTATPENKVGLQRLWMLHFGKEIYRDLSQETAPECFFIQTNTRIDMNDRSILDVTGELSLPLLYGVLGRDADRNEIIRSVLQDALDKERQVLCLSFSKDHCRTLHSMFDGSGLCTGDVPNAKERRKNLHQSDVTFGTMPLGKEGLDKKELDTVFVLMPFSNEGMLRQILGRVLRPYGKPPIALFMEDIHIPPCRSLCKKLRVLLEDIGYSVKTVRRYLDLGELPKV